MDIGMSAFDHIPLQAIYATHSLVRLVARLPLSLVPSTSSGQARPRPAASSLHGSHVPSRTIERVQPRFLG
jgi:hypothetical protein